MRKFFFAAAVAVVSLFGSAASADAAFAVRFASGAASLVITDGSAQDNNVGDTTRIAVNSADAMVAAFIAASGFDITGGTFSFRNGTGGGGSSVLTEAQTEVTRIGAGSGTISITVGYDGYTLPTGGLLAVNSTISFSGITTTPVSNYQFTNWADNVPPAQDLITPTGVSSTTGLVSLATQIPPGSVSPLTTPQSLFVRTTTPFQVTSRSVITLGGTGDFVSFTATTNIAAVPAPAGLVLALTAMPVLGLGTWVRRRRTQAGV